MRRGTTPTHTFQTSIDLSGADVIYVTYKQNGTLIVEKTIDDLTVTSEQVELTLTQEETLSFQLSYPVSVQIRARIGNKAVACDVIEVQVEDVLKGGVI